MDQSTEKMICNPCNKERIELGIDGDHAFALLGEDIQSGWSAFVKMEKDCSCSGDWCLSHKVETIPEPEPQSEPVRVVDEEPKEVVFSGPPVAWTRDGRVKV